MGISLSLAGAIARVAAFGTCIVACGAVKGLAPPDAAAPARIVVTPSDVTTKVKLNGPTQLAAFAELAAGSDDITTAVTWTSANPAVATVSASGLVTAVGSGATTIDAQYGALSASAMVTAVDPTMMIALIGGLGSGTGGEEGDGPGGIAFYDAFASGNGGGSNPTVLPTREIIGSASGLYDGSFLWEFAQDGSNAYIADESGSDGKGQVLAYPLDGGGLGSNAFATPIIQLAGSNTLLEEPLALAIDDTAGELFVGIDTGILVFNKTDTGNVAPKRQLNFALEQAYGMQIRNGKIWVSSLAQPSIYVFDEQATGSATPELTITGANTGYSEVDGLTFGSNGEMWVSDVNTSSEGVFLPPADTGSGGTVNLAPIRRVAGTETYAAGGIIQISLGAFMNWGVTFEANTAVSFDPAGTADAPAITTLLLPGSPRGVLVY